MTVAVLDTPRCDLGEGPVWDPDRRRLSWVDIDAGRLHVRAADGATSTWSVAASTLSAAFPEPGPDDAWFLVVDQGFGHLSADGVLARLSQPEAGQAAHVRMNDAAIDPQGRVWAGSMSTDGSRGRASLYRVDGAVERVRAGLNAANGLGWSPAGDRLYLVDSDPGVLWIHDVDPASGDLMGVRACVDGLGPGIPDGLAVDAAGCLWIAFYGAGQLRRFDPSGRLMSHVDLPATHPTSACFGEHGLDRLYVTTARVGADGPADGRILAVDVAVAGLPIAPLASHLDARAPESAPPLDRMRADHEH